MNLDPPALEQMPLTQILSEWRPGSHDWSWDDEFAYLMRRPETYAIAERVRSEGIAFVDDIAPVMLGSDGRVWDGHHRICIARMSHITHLHVERVVHR